MYGCFDPSFLGGGLALSSKIFSCFTTGHACGTARALCLGKDSFSPAAKCVQGLCPLLSPEPDAWKAERRLAGCFFSLQGIIKKTPVTF